MKENTKKGLLTGVVVFFSLAALALFITTLYFLLNGKEDAGADYGQWEVYLHFSSLGPYDCNPLYNFVGAHSAETL